MAASSKAGITAASIVILAIFFSFARPGLSYYLTDDDIMNLRHAWPDGVGKYIEQILNFDPQAYRPVGLLFYRGMFALAGLNPGPYHWACFALLILNLFLLFLVVRDLTGSLEVAALAALLASFHSRTDALYDTAASVYDILCYTLYFTFLLLYIRWRRSGTGAWPITIVSGFVLLYLLALNTKEIAVTLPVILVAYELLYQPARRRAAWVLLALTIVVTGIFCLSKLGTGTPLTMSYRPQFTLSRFFETWEGFLGLLAYRDAPVPAGVVIAVWVALIGTALLLRSKAFALGCVLILIGPLPVCVVAPRGITVLYVPFFSGWPICLAVLILAVRDRISRESRRQWSTIGVFGTVAALLIAAHLHDRPNRFLPNQGKNEEVCQFQSDFTRLHPKVARGSAILLIDDPFGSNEWTPVSLLQLVYRDPDLNVLRRKIEDQRPEIAKTEFDIVMTLRDGHMVDAGSVSTTPAP